MPLRPYAAEISDDELDQIISIISNLEVITNYQHQSITSLTNELNYVKLANAIDLKLAKFNGQKSGMWIGIAVMAVFIATGIGVSYLITPRK